MNTNTQAAFTSLAGRVLLASLFLFSGFGKLAAPAATKGYIAASGMPFPDLAFIAALIVELGFATALVLGYKARLIALLMAGFTVLTAVVFHNNFADQGQLINFLKNIAIAGGLLQIAANGAGAFSLDARRRKTLAIA